MIARIYKITNADMLPYIGSTTRTLKQRLGDHRTAKDCSAVTLLNGNESIILLEEFEYLNEIEIKIKEQYYLDLIPNCNQVRAYNSVEDTLKYHAEYREKNKEQIAIKGKKWREKNKEHIAVRNKEHEKKNKDIRSTQHKEWYNKNLENRAIYLLKNKEDLTIKRKIYNLKIKYKNLYLAELQLYNI